MVDARKLLLIDDDEKLADLLRQFFQRFDYQLESTTSPLNGLDMASSGDFALVILDVMLPELDGFETCRQLRKHSDIPVLMLTARGDTMDRVIGLEIGADDYLAKPFEPRELLVRIQNIIKRTYQAPAPSALVHYDSVSIDFSRRVVQLRGDEPVQLSAMEYQLLALLAQNAGKIMSRDEILQQLKGIETDIYSRSIDILVSRLRHKLKPFEPIKTVRGMGYVFSGVKH
ncbi:MAG: DNA-binding response regulator [Kangiellaceae bacterium]|nr:DNA-binding response regulator [Kangiellaceae bacterium]